MKAYTTIKSWGALALGLFFTGVTAATILKDVVVDGAPFTIIHLQAAAALVAAIASGHFIWPTLKQGSVPAALGLLLIFTGATGYIITSAGARNAEMAGIKAMEVAKRNQARVESRKVLADAERETVSKRSAEDDAVRSAAKECSTGKKTKCEGTIATREAAKADHERAKDAEQLARGKMLLLGPDEQEFAGYHHAARTLAALGYGEASATEARLELAMPFSLVLISELATLVFMSMAFGQTYRPVEAPVRTETRQEPSVQVSDPSKQTDYPSVSEADLSNVRMLFAANDDPSGPNGGTKVRRWSRDEVRADLTSRIERGEEWPSQRELARTYGVPTSTLSDWFSVWAEEGAEVERVKIGRRNAVG